MPSNIEREASLFEEVAMNDNTVTKESAQQIVLDFVRKRKCTDKVDISSVEKANQVWVIRGTCPIDLEGHPWAERFEIVLDVKGKIRSTNYALL
jgi:hypothetical protein